LGKGSLQMVLMHSVLWPLTLNATASFRTMPVTLRMAGRNDGPRGLRIVLQILILAAVILIGLAVEAAIVQTLERCTVRRWGMQR
jgi:NitT/TauT family transport system permease protein